MIINRVKSSRSSRQVRRLSLKKGKTTYKMYNESELLLELENDNPNNFEAFLLEKNEIVELKPYKENNMNISHKNLLNIYGKTLIK